MLLLVATCSFRKNLLVNQIPKGHSQLYSEPRELDKSESRPSKKVRRIVIASTNDLHGRYSDQIIEFQDQHHKGAQTIKVGGVDYISSYFKILRQEYGQILMLDSGDIFSDQSHEASYTQDFYSVLGYDGFTLGLRDFNQKLPNKYKSLESYLKDFAAASKAPLILSNLYDLKSAQVVDWTGTLPYLIKEINGVKVGIMAILPDDVVEQTPVDNRVGLYVENMLQSTLRNARLLRSLGAEMIVMMTHQGLKCGEEIAEELKLPLSKVNFEPEKSDVCNLESPLGELLKRMPPQLVDVIITGRSQMKTANMVNGTLIMNSFSDGKSFSYTELFVDAQTKKLLPSKTIVHQPVMFCQEFFKETDDCYTEDSSVDHKARKAAKFLGYKITPDPSVEQKFYYFLKKELTTQIEFGPQIESVLRDSQGDIAFSTGTNAHSKLIMLHLTGAELSKILEQDFNQENSRHWHPSPYRLIGEQLKFSLKGLDLNPQETYRVLGDILDLQAHGLLNRFITKAMTRSLHNSSWSEPALENDKVSTSMAASEAVR